MLEPEGCGVLEEKSQAGEDGHPVFVVNPSKALQVKGTGDTMVGCFCSFTTLTTTEDDPGTSRTRVGNGNASKAFKAVLK